MSAACHLLFFHYNLIKIYVDARICAAASQNLAQNTSKWLLSHCDNKAEDSAAVGCVCVRERERESEGLKHCVFVCMCVNNIYIDDDGKKFAR